jgi:shikimate dehydrogenase
VETVNAILNSGLATIAKTPQSNPQSLDFEHYTVPVIAEDYPAKTAVMWNTLYGQLRIPAGNIMIVADPADTEIILDAFRHDPRYFGGGAGVGFKEVVVPFLDEIDPLAKAIGAVNFIAKISGNRLKGFNTDGTGYAQGLEEVLKKNNQTLKNKKVVVIGAGGAANAVAFALAQGGAKIVIINRTLQRAVSLANEINNYFSLSGNMEVQADAEDSIAAHVCDADVVVNVSTKGAAGELVGYSALAPAKLPATAENISENKSQADIVFDAIPKTAIISDIVLGKEDTPMLKRAKELGYQTLDGIPMVINQGAEAFRILYGEFLEKNGISGEFVREVMSKAALG